MGRPLRYQAPNTFHFISVRCLESRFLLRPDAELNALFGLWLARAQAWFPGVVLYGAIAMSNHIHLLVRDGKPQDLAGQLSGLMGFFIGNFAKAVNRLRGGRRGPVFERRYDSQLVLDNRAAVVRLRYLITNPVEANLVDRHEDWPGVLLYTTVGSESKEFRWFNRSAWKRAVARAPSGSLVAKAGFIEKATLTISSLPGALPSGELALLGGLDLLKLDPQSSEVLCTFPLKAASEAPVENGSAVALAEARQIEERLAKDRAAQGRRTMGAAKVRAQDPFGVPSRTKRSPRPLCHTSCLALLRVFRSAWRKLRSWYAEASKAFRSGRFDVEFPPYVFRPHVNLLVPGLPLPAT